jgi:pseudouridine synthase
VNGSTPSTGYDVQAHDTVSLDGTVITAPATAQTIVFNKPVGCVVSRDGQGSQTIYDILPPALHHLKPVGRLDKYSSGLLLLTNDGALHQQLTHPRYQKVKIYEIILNHPLQPLHRQMIEDHGVLLADGPSKLQLERLRETNDTAWRITMREGRNRQIRRTFEALGYTVSKLHRTHFGPYSLNNLGAGMYQTI